MIAFGVRAGARLRFLVRAARHDAVRRLHLLTSLLSFNLGVEIGQLLVLVLSCPALDAAVPYVVAERIGTIILSALVAHTGWHWMIERGDQLGRYSSNGRI